MVASEFRFVEWNSAVVFLVIALCLPIFIGFWHQSFFNKVKTFFGEIGRQYLVTNYSSTRFLWRCFFWSIGLLMAVLALARPQVPGGFEEIKSQGIEVMLVVDISESMLAEDMNPNRLTAMKYDLMRFVDRLPGHSIGLVAFAGSAHLISPLTTDLGIIKMYIEQLNPAFVSTQGSEISPAIDVAMDAFQHGEDTDLEDWIRTTRLILVASDGEDHDPDALKKAADIVKEKQVKVFTVAYGSTEGGRIPVRDSLGQTIGFKKTKSGEDVVTRVNLQNLKDLADAGNGIYAHALESPQFVDEFVDTINSYSKSEKDRLRKITYAEIYSYFLWPAFAFVFLALFVSHNRRSHNRRVVAQWLCVLGLTFFSHSARAEFKTLSGWYHYLKAQGAFISNNLGEVKQLILKSLIKDPFSSELQNLYGLLLMKTKDHLGACQAFAAAERFATNFNEQFISRFNLGTCYHARGMQEEALQAYLSALEINPQSRETKINIELLLQEKQSKPDDQSGNEGNEGNNEQEKKEPQGYKNNPPQRFKSENLSEAQVRRIIEELKNQEQKIRMEYFKHQRKDRPKEKDW
ncbi:MAG: VWA domain-containing protein [Bdellovibrionaceae bacterium]|nr:VWA domain-containing protein [Pseudobdellovibrionaceae bacterium]MDW8189618.1 VWA domain-containing protein [Pseudobdellovibrionaceae bacterium]